MANIPLPETALKCPRCESTNTKFCYFNNYSLSQPRHFCKDCRRYWTSGGALRNVPVGGGCRRNKRRKSTRSKSPASSDRQNNHNPNQEAASAPAGGGTAGLTPPLQFMSSLNHVENFNSGITEPDNELNFHGGSTGFLAGRVAGGGTLIQQFPFLSSNWDPSGIYQFHQSMPFITDRRPKLKMEENPEFNLSRYLFSGNHEQQLNPNLSSFSSSSTSNNPL